MFKSELENEEMLFFPFTFYEVSDSWMCIQILLYTGENDQIHFM